MNRRRLFELKRDFLKPQREMFDRIDQALRGERGPARMTCRAFLGGMIFLFLNSQPPTLARLERLFKEEANGKELRAFGLAKPPTYMQLSWALSRLCKYLDPKADQKLPQVMRMRALMGCPSERLIDLFSDWLVASTLKMTGPSAIRTVDGSYIDGYCRPMKATDIKMARKALAQTRARHRSLLSLITGNEVDASPPPKENLYRLPSDPDAYPRTIQRPAGGTRSYMGYVVTAQRLVSPDSEYIEKVRVGPANAHEYDHGLAMLKRSLDQGTLINFLLADRGFSQNPGFRQGVRQLGVDLVFDLKSDQRGPDGTYRGCLALDGWLFLPSLPEELRNIKALAINASKTEKEHWRQLMRERHRYAVRIKERMSPCKVRVSSPALRLPGPTGERGPGCRHPLLAHTMRWRNPKLATCPGNHAVDEACGLQNATWAAEFSPRTERCFSTVPFGSKPWQELFAGRSSSERGFNVVKNSDMIGLHKGRIRWRGTMRVTLLLTMAVAAHNLWLGNLQPKPVPRIHPRVVPLAA